MVTGNFHITLSGYSQTFRDKIYFVKTGGEIMQPGNLAYHETMETHELLNFKTVGLLKSKMMQGIVFDQDLKAMMEKNVQQSIKDIQELQALYQQAKTH